MTAFKEAYLFVRYVILIGRGRKISELGVLEGLVTGGVIVRAAVALDEETIVV